MPRQRAWCRPPLKHTSTNSCDVSASWTGRCCHAFATSCCLQEACLSGLRFSRSSSATVLLLLCVQQVLRPIPHTEPHDPRLWVQGSERVRNGRSLEEGELRAVFEQQVPDADAFQVLIDRHGQLFTGGSYIGASFFAAFKPVQPAKP